MRKLIPKPGSKLGPMIATKGITEVARLMKVSIRTVRNWLEVDGVPIRRVLKLSEVLDIDPNEVFQMTKPINIRPKRVLKTPQCVETLLKAYEGKDFVIEPPLTPRSLYKTLEYYGDRVPVLADTLVKLSTKTIDVGQAAEILGITKPSVHGLRARYGIKPGNPKKKVVPPGRYKQNAVKNRQVSLAVISGRMSATEAVKKYGVALRSLHRYIKADLVDFGLNELSHWPGSLRFALAEEIEHDQDRISVRWFNKYRTQGWTQADVKPPDTDHRLEACNSQALADLIPDGGDHLAGHR